MTDARARTVVAIRVVSDLVGVTTILSKVGTFRRAVADAAGVTDSLARVVAGPSITSVKGSDS